MKTFQNLKENPHLWERYFIKEYTIKAIRKFFENRDYHELESPILSDSLPQERYLDVLSTDLEFADGSKKEVYLIPSTETWNKRILAAGLGNHFVITKVFRGLEEISLNHSPEFTMLEWYEMGHTYMDIMDSCEELSKFIIDFLKSKNLKTYKFEDYKVEYRGNIIDFSGKWDRFSVRELLRKYLNVELEGIKTLEQIYNFAKLNGFDVRAEDDWQSIFEIMFSSKIEPNFSKSKPTFVYNFPKILCPLTKEKEGDAEVCEKCEIYIAGKEIGNVYTELLDAEEQEKRFLEEQKARKELGKKDIKFDHDLVAALKLGVDPVAGIGIGIDRLVMILANAHSISDINFFPASEWE